MPNRPIPAIPFGARSTAEEVLAGLDLAGRTILITGCTAGIGFETMRALAAHGAHVIGLARSESAAREAAVRAGGRITPVACDQGDLASIDAAVATVRGLGLTLDAIIANAGVMGAPKVERIQGVEKQFWVNHVAHARLIEGLLDRLPDGSGRIVLVSSAASIGMAPRAGILFDDLDGAKAYKAMRFYGQSKLANALHAVELSRRLAGRGIAANALHPGVILGTRFLRNMAGPIRLLARLLGGLGKTIPQGAATQTLLAASPLAEGLTGLYWSDCRPAQGSRHLADAAMASALWTATEAILARAEAA